MKKLLIWCVLMILALPIYAQKKIKIDRLPENKKDSTIIAIAKAAVLKYGPDYYREYGKPEIEAGTFDVAMHHILPELNGKKVYRVTFYYDKSKEELLLDYITHVSMLAESGIVYRIDFGTGFGLGVYETETRPKTKNSKDEIYVVPYYGKKK